MAALINDCFVNIQMVAIVFIVRLIMIDDDWLFLFNYDYDDPNV